MTFDQKTDWSLSRKRAALRYARLGWRVVAMHAVKNGACFCLKAEACERPGKHPRTEHGVKDATNNIEQLKEWWDRWPHANIGVATGEPSGIVVLDIDPRHDGDETLKTLEAELGPLPQAPTAISGGGGRHLFFRCPPVPVRTDSSGERLGPGVDVLSTGSIVIVPPSRHVSGKRYVWAEGKDPECISPSDLPQSWLVRLREDAADEALGAEERSAADLITEGRRNTHLTSVGGALQRIGATREAISAALNAENSTRISPPLDGAEVERIVTSVTSYPSNPLGNAADVAEGVMQIVLAKHFGGGKHLLLGTDGRFWNYDGRLWRPVSEQWVSGKVLDIIQSTSIKGQKTASLLSQTLTLLKAKLAVKDDVLSFVANPPPVINCANGELWLADDGTVELRPHRPESYLRDCIDVAYDPEAKCPAYDAAVRQIFAKAENPNSMARHWNEIVGYVIQPRRNISVILVLLGGGDNGKTVLMQTVIRLLGNDLVCARRVEDLEKSRFAVGSLFGKRLFVDDDVKAGARLPDGMLKTISEAKTVTGELKYHSDFNFVVRAVPALLCNNIPSLADLSHGMRRRLMVIPFDRRFTNQDRDPELFEQIWANELPGVLNRALAGYKRMIERQFRFKRPLPVKSATEHWLQQANPLPAFIDECCVRRAERQVTMKKFYSAYTTWTEAMGYTLAQTQQTVTRNLQHLGFATRRTNQGVAVIGLKLRNS